MLLNKCHNIDRCSSGVECAVPESSARAWTLHERRVTKTYIQNVASCSAFVCDDVMNSEDPPASEPNDIKTKSGSPGRRSKISFEQK